MYFQQDIIAEGCWLILSKKHGAVLLFVLLLIFWYVLSLKVTITITIIGFFVSVMVVFYNYDLIFNNQEASKLSLKLIRRLLTLFFVLIYNIVKSNIQVAKIVLSKKMPIDPGFVTIKNPLDKDMNRAFYANAITLTPGTLTVEMDEKEIVVHSLVKKQGEALTDSNLEKAFVALEEVEKHD